VQLNCPSVRPSVIEYDMPIHFTYNTPLDDGLSLQQKNLSMGRFRERPAFHDILDR